MFVIVYTDSVDLEKAEITLSVITGNYESQKNPLHIHFNFLQILLQLATTHNKLLP